MKKLFFILEAHDLIMRTLMRFLLIFISIYFLSACSIGEKHSDFMGYWLKEGLKNSNANIMYVYKDGDSYLFKENIFKKTDSFGREIQPLLLSSKDGKLAFSNGLANYDLGLSKDNNKLYFAGATYTRIDETKMNSIKQEIESCRLAGKEFSEKTKGLSLFKKEDQAQRKKLQQEYYAKLKKTKYCYLPSGARSN